MSNLKMCRVRSLWWCQWIYEDTPQMEKYTRARLGLQVNFRSLCRLMIAAPNSRVQRVFNFYIRVGLGWATCSVNLWSMHRMNIIRGHDVLFIWVLESNSSKFSHFKCCQFLVQSFEDTRYRTIACAVGQFKCMPVTVIMATFVWESHSKA